MDNPVILINVRENRRGNQEWTILSTLSTQDTGSQKHNTEN
jgi:hypothetical protein